jgi:hypothetical protein
MFRLFIFLLTFCTNILSGQNLGIQQYWKEVYEAERNICTRSYNNSVEYYQAAFNLKDHPLEPIDFYNASLCGIYAEKFDFTESCMVSMVQLGFPFTFFEKKQSYKPFRESRNWTSFVSRYSENRKKHLLGINVNRKADLENLLFKDSHIRVIRQGDELDFRGANWTITPDTISKYDKKLCPEIIEFVEKYGFPNAHHDGLLLKQDTLIDLYTIFELFFHSYLAECPGFTDLLMPELLRGEIRPDLFWQWYSYELNRKNNISFGPTTTFVFLNGEPYIEKFNTARLPEFNQNRKALYLPTFAESCKKFCYTKTNLVPQDFLLSPYINNMLLNAKSEDEINFLLPALNKVQYNDIIDK